MGAFDFLPSIPNPLDYVPDIPIPDIPNPLDYLPDLPHIPNPIDILPSVPNPLDLLPDIPNPFSHYGDKAAEITHDITEGEVNTAPDPALAKEGQTEKSKFQAQAFAALGVDEKTFATMDPIKRNALINAQYAKMYKSDPETLKWAGMAAMASDKAGTGMMQTYMLSGAEAIPGGETLRDAAGAPDGDKVRELLAKGNAGIYNDMMWQHMAFQQGGIAEMEKARKEGSITQEQLDGWKQVASGKDELADAKKSGDKAAIDKANADIWGGNKGLLKEEQHFIQDQVYDDSPEAHEAFKFLSGPMNVMGVSSPVPGGTTFGEDRKTKPGDPDVANFPQRWSWIEDEMLPEYQKFESDPTKMNAEMDKYIGREHKNQWDVKAVDPLVKGMGGPIMNAPLLGPLMNGGNPFNYLFD